MIDTETVRFYHDGTDVFEYGTYTTDVRRRERADRTWYERCERAQRFLEREDPE